MMAKSSLEVLAREESIISSWVGTLCAGSELPATSQSTYMPAYGMQVMTRHGPEEGKGQGHASGALPGVYFGLISNSVLPQSLSWCSLPTH